MPTDEQRRERRRRVLKGATIIIDTKTSEIACVVRNQHERGAELKVHPEIALPPTFTLYVPADQIAYRCELRWRSRERVGVAFTGTGPKPRFHYG
ncbi:MAG: PilZ domain-containing protein [Rhizobiaceae bacterium]